MRGYRNKLGNMKQVLPFHSFLAATNMLLHLLILAFVTQTIFPMYSLADPGKARGCFTKIVVVLFPNAPHSLYGRS